MGRGILVRRSMLFVTVALIGAIVLLGSGYLVSAAGIGQDGREGLNGPYLCEGTTATVNNSRPFYGDVNISWEVPQTVMLIYFKEYNAPEGVTPLEEWQYWTYDVATATHSRFIRDGSGNTATITSKGWEGDAMHWKGTFNVSGVGPLPYRETITRYSNSEYRYAGQVVYAGEAALFHYDLVCKKTQ